MDNQTLVAVIGLTGVLLAGNGIISMLLAHKLKKHDRIDATDKRVEKLYRTLDRIAEGLNLSLECHLVEFDAMREGKINGAAELQARKVQDYFVRSTEKGYHV
jgi:hypothetical protein